MAKRLTEKEKKEIARNFSIGKSLDDLSKEFECTKLTISRNLIRILGEKKYRDFIQKNKSLRKNMKESIKESTKEIDKNNSFENKSEFHQNIKNL